MQFIEHLQESISNDRKAVLNHPLYKEVKTESDLRKFASHHVFAVWDFMSLLKSLQSRLTCVSTPWVPVGAADTRFLINEIVVGEESDVDEGGFRCSHFELYVKAMEQMEADVSGIKLFIKHLQNGMSVADALEAAAVPVTVQRFVLFTFQMVDTAADHEVAAVFTFGREDLIPGMFVGMVKDLDKRFPGRFDVFRYYLERHIEVDGDHHSLLALQMVTELCGRDAMKWKEATEAARTALQLRKQLWDGIYNEIRLQATVDI